MAAPASTSNGVGGPSSNANDCLALLSKAVSSPDPADRKRSLSRLIKVLETSPGFLPILYGTFMGMLGGPVGSEGVVRRWVVEVMELAVCRGVVGPDQRLQLAVQSIEPLFRLMKLDDPSDSMLLDTKKIGVQVLSSAYPLLFRHAVAANSSAAATSWGLMQQLKGEVLARWRNEAASVGVRVAASKFVQRVIQVGTKAGGDPRRRAEDPNVIMVSASHTFLKAKEIETEATALLEEAVRMLYTSRSPDFISALMVVLGLLIRTRPSHANLVITALVSWTPATLSAPTPGAPALSYTQLRGPEKTLRIALSYIDRTAAQSGLSSYSSQIRGALMTQAQRMDRAAEEARLERERLATAKRQRIEADAASYQQDLDPDKRPRHSYDQPGAPAMAPSGSGQGPRPPPAPQNLLPGFDVRTLPVELVSELIIANFQVMTDQTLEDALSRIRQSMAQEASVPAVKPLPDDEEDEEELEFQEPPRMDADLKSGRALDDKADEAEAAAAAEEEEQQDALPSEAFELPPPEPLADDVRATLLRSTLERLAENGMQGMKGRLGGVDAATGAGALMNELWVAMLARLATRGLLSGKDESAETAAEEEARREAVRDIIYEFIVSDLQNRMEFARVWLNEEWYSGRARSPQALAEAADSSPYGRWLRRLLDYIVEHSSAQDRSFSTFLIDLPEVPKAEVRRLESMCNNAEQLQNGFTTLRELAMLRPPVRQEAMDVLLGLTTHSAKQTRNAAIVTVKSWVPETEPLAGHVVAFALQLLDRLEKDAKPEDADVKMAGMGVNGESKKEDEGELEAGEEPPEVTSCGLVEDGVVVSGLPPATSQETVRQHLELLFALSVKSPDLLDPLFAEYGSLPPHVQEAVGVLITPLIRSLGAKHPKVVELVQSCPAGSQELVLRILGVLTEKSRAPPILVEAIKTLASEQADLSPRFIVPIMADLDKPEIVKHLPRILTLLDGTAANKALIRTIFEGIIEMPPQNFGSVSTNAPRVKQSELLTPVELLALLHRSEKETGLKQAIEAINICFSMTEVFRPEVLAAFMQQVVDELTLPTLFLRTVIQAVQTYKSLQPFVSTTLLSRLIIKKIWTQPQLWEGFVRCAKTIAPHSFGALLQLPRDQLREVVAKQPALKGPLRDYVIKKAGNNRARVAPMLEILSDQPPAGGGPTPLTVLPAQG